MTEKKTPDTETVWMGRDLEQTLDGIRKEQIPERLLELARQLQAQLRLRGAPED